VPESIPIVVDRRWATVAEAADRIKVTTKTIRVWIGQGRLTGYRFGPNTVRVDLDELDALGTA
jgi:excisionase family DNA binding protein